MTTASFAATGAVQTWTCPAGITEVVVDAAGGQGGSYGSVGGKGGRVQLTLAVTPGQDYDVYVGVAGSAPGGGWPDGANGGATGLGTADGSGGGGATWIVEQGGAKDNALVMAGAGGGASANAGASVTATLNTETDPSSAAHNGGAGSVGKRAGGGGGGGWRGGSAGAANNGGGGGTSMYRTTATSDVGATGAYQSGDGYLTLTWSYPPITAGVARAALDSTARPGTAVPGTAHPGMAAAERRVSARPLGIVPGHATVLVARATTATAARVTDAFSVAAPLAQAPTAVIARPVTLTFGPATTQVGRATVTTTARQVRQPAGIPDKDLSGIVKILEQDAYATPETSLTVLGRLATPAAKPGVVLLHGHGSSSVAMPCLFALGYEFDTVDFLPRLTRRHAAIIVPDAGGPHPWSNDTALGAVTQAADHLAATHATTDPIALIGFSMGALTALNWARAHPDRVACVAGLFPLVNLQDFYDRNVEGFAAEIATALGGAQNIPNYDPAAHTADYADMPIRLWWSTNDPVIDPDTVHAFAAAVGAEETSMGPAVHSQIGFNPEQLAEWVAEHLPTPT